MHVDFFAEYGYMQIKLHSSIEPAWIGPLAERAHANGIRLSGHIPVFMAAQQEVETGCDEIQQINMVFLNFVAATATAVLKIATLGSARRALPPQWG